MRPYGDRELVKMGSGHGLSPEGTKSLPEPMLTNHQWGLVEFSWGNFNGHAEYVYPWYEFENYIQKITAASPKGQ